MTQAFCTCSEAWRDKPSWLLEDFTSHGNAAGHDSFCLEACINQHSDAYLGALNNKFVSEYTACVKQTAICNASLSSHLHMQCTISNSKHPLNMVYIPSGFKQSLTQQIMNLVRSYIQAVCIDYAPCTCDCMIA